MRRILLYLLTLGTFLAPLGVPAYSQTIASVGPPATAPVETGDGGRTESLVCMSCHRFNGVGADVAGDLGSMRDQTRDALKMGLSQPVNTHVLSARLPGGGAVAVVRRAWTGQLYDLSVTPPKAHAKADFESVLPYPSPGWMHPSEARDYDDSKLDLVLNYLKVFNSFGEELRTAQQKESDWEKLDRDVFAEIGSMNICDGRIEKRVQQIKAGELASYQAWRAYYDKWTQEDVAEQNKKRADPALLQASIERENDVIKDLSSQINRLTTDLEAIRIRKGNTSGDETLLAGLKASLEQSQERIDSLARAEQKILIQNTIIDQTIDADKLAEAKLETFHKSASEIYDERIIEFGARCSQENHR